jgi:uncharacterized membrane protein YjjP (DUF1212 family)
MSRKQIIDSIVNSWISKKLTVFAIGSAALFNGYVTSGDWIIIASIYIGSQTVIDVVSLLKAKSGSTNYTEEFNG